MARYVNASDIIHATFRCARKYGLSAVTMNTIGKEVGILGQGLYNHFSSKDDILSSAFNYCDRQLSDLFEGYQLDPGDDFESALKKLWFRYFDYFVQHPDERSFYRQFRESIHFPRKAERDPSYFRALGQIIAELESRFHFREDINRDAVQLHVQYMTPVYAEMADGGDPSQASVLRESIWNMMFSGFSGILK